MSHSVVSKRLPRVVIEDTVLRVSRTIAHLASKLLVLPPLPDFLADPQELDSLPGKVEITIPVFENIAHFAHTTIRAKINTVTNIKLIPKQFIRIKLRILRIKLIPKTIMHEITDVTDIADFYRVYDHGLLIAVHKSKHSLFRLKITVGC